MTIALTSLLLALGPAALLVVMAVAFAETGLLAGFFLPGDTLLFTTGVLVAGGVISLPLWLVVAGVAAACVAGDQLGYLVGRRFGPKLFSRPRSRLFSPTHAARTEEFFAKHGPKAVILARFIAVLRTFTPVAAGLAGMPRRQFMVYNMIGGLAWSGSLLAAGFLLGGIPVIAAHVELFVLAIVALSLLPVVAAIWRSRGRRAPLDSAPVADDPVLELAA